MPTSNKKMKRRIWYYDLYISIQVLAFNIFAVVLFAIKNTANLCKCMMVSTNFMEATLFFFGAIGTYILGQDELKHKKQSSMRVYDKVYYIYYPIVASIFFIFELIRFVRCIYKDLS